MTVDRDLDDLLAPPWAYLWAVALVTLALGLLIFAVL